MPSTDARSCGPCWTPCSPTTLPRKLFNQIVKEDGVQARTTSIPSFRVHDKSLSIQIDESPDPTTRSRLTYLGLPPSYHAIYR